MRNPFSALIRRLKPAAAAPEAASPAAPVFGQGQMKQDGADASVRPIGQTPLEPLRSLRAPQTHRETYEPTRASGDTEIHEELLDLYGQRAEAGTHAMSHPPMDGDKYHTDRILLIQTDDALAQLRDWLNQARQAHHMWVIAVRTEATRLAGSTRGERIAGRIVLLGLPFGIAVVFMVVLGESVHLLFLDSWFTTIIQHMQQLNDTQTGDEIVDTLRQAAPIASALLAGVIGLAANLAPALLVLATSGRLHIGVKALLFAIDLALGYGVYQARMASSLAAQAPSAAIIEIAMLLVNTAVAVGMASSLKRAAELDDARRLAVQAVASCAQVLDDLLTNARQAYDQARRCVDAVGSRDFAEHITKRDAELVRLEAQIGCLEAAIQNKADLLQPAIPQARAAAAQPAGVQ